MAAGLSVMLSLMFTEPPRLSNRHQDRRAGCAAAGGRQGDDRRRAAARRCGLRGANLALYRPALPDREHAKAPATREPSGGGRSRAADRRAQRRHAPVAPPSPAPAEPQPNITQQDNFASHQHEWTAESDRIMQDESDEEWVPMMPPPEHMIAASGGAIPIRAARSSANSATSRASFSRASDPAKSRASACFSARSPRLSSSLTGG